MTFPWQINIFYFYSADIFSLYCCASVTTVYGKCFCATRRPATTAEEFVCQHDGSKTIEARE